LPAPVGAISKTERPACALANNSNWCARGVQPRAANQRVKGSGSGGFVSMRSNKVIGFSVMAGHSRRRRRRFGDALCPGHPRLPDDQYKTWMPGIKPGMTA
jgi:hypothetical protein